AVDNKPSTVDSKEQTLRLHLLPFFGKVRLDAVTYAGIQDFKVKKIEEGVGRKTVNNFLTVLRRMLVIARKRGFLSALPEIEWLKYPRPEFDCLTFEEASRLVGAADGEWKTVLLVALRTGDAPRRALRASLAGRGPRRRTSDGQAEPRPRPLRYAEVRSRPG